MKFPIQVSIFDSERSNVADVQLCDSLDILRNVVTQCVWSSVIYTNNKRGKAHFQTSYCFGLDLDNTKKPLITQAQFAQDLRTLGYTYILTNSKSHRIAKHGIVADRCRAILFFSSPITSLAIYEATVKHITSQLAYLDQVTVDGARLWFPSTGYVETWEGKFVEAVQVTRTDTGLLQRGNEAGFALKDDSKGKLSYKTLEFLEHGIGNGEWNPRLYAAAMDFNQQGYTKYEAYEHFRSMKNSYFSGTLDKKDVTTIESAFKAVPNYPPRLPAFNTDLQFPVVSVQKNGERPAPIKTHPDNAKYLLIDVLKHTIRQNIISEKIILDGKEITDMDLSIIRNRFRECNLASDKEFIIDSLNEISNKNQFHPFKDVVDDVKWDGKKHIEGLFSTLKIPEDSTQEQIDLYKLYLKRWLIGLIAKIYKPGAQNLMLIFKGLQGAGKSRWFSRLSLYDGMMGEGSINPENKDHVFRHINYIIWHCSELDQITRKADMAAFKDYLTKETINERAAYGRFDRFGKSILSFVGTVNEDKFLTDSTGSRRFLIIPIDDLNAEHNVDIKQVYAQAKQLYDNGEQWWFDKKEIVTINAENSVYSHEDEVDYMATKYKPGKVWMPLIEIYKPSEQNNRTNRASLVKLGNLLKLKGCTKERRVINGTKLTGYYIEQEKEH